MAGEIVKDGRAEEAWKWLCRGLAVIGYGVLLLTVGFRAPIGGYLLLLALFFGPEVILGQLQINRRSKRDRDDE